MSDITLSVVYAGERSKFQLSEQQRQVLAAIHTDADLTVPQIANRVGQREHTVRATLKRLTNFGIVRKRTSINSFRLGYGTHDIFLALTAEGFKNRLSLMSFLVSNPYINFVGELGGTYQVRIGLVVRNLRQHTTILDEIMKRFPSSIDRHAMVSFKEAADYPIRWLLNGRKQTRPIVHIQPQEILKIDELDHRILLELSDIGENSLTAIARRLGHPVSTLEYRISRLKSEGVILRTRYVVDSTRLGHSHFFHLLQLRNCGEEVRKALLNFCEHHPNVYFSVVFLGAWDFEIGTSGENASDIIQFGEELYALVGREIVEITTLPLLRCYKVTDFPGGL